LKLYRVLLSTKTNIILKPEQTENIFRAENFSITLRKIRNEIDRKLADSKYGWFLEFEGEAPDLNAAFKFAFDMSEYFLSVLSLETGVESHRSNPILGYDITPGVKEREFIQFFYNSPYSRLQVADFTTYSDHLNAVWLYDSPRKDRINRAVRWFRKGLNEEDPLDQFLALWQGLETLNPVLLLYRPITSRVASHNFQYRYDNYVNDTITLCKLM